jgi:hypothetical protein
MNYESRDFSTNHFDINQNGTSSFVNKPNEAYYNRIVGLYIQYGIIQGYESTEVVKLAYFDDTPLEPRYYMFGR